MDDDDTFTECGEEYENMEIAFSFTRHADETLTSTLYGNEHSLMHVFATECRERFSSDFVNQRFANISHVPDVLEAALEYLQRSILGPASKTYEFSWSLDGYRLQSVDVFIRELRCRTAFSRPSSPVSFRCDAPTTNGELFG